ncbi:MAG: VIT1/CCC1 family protein, partial [Endomicrobiaceae bacterium]|nr:VIT1/CCC1 family protein [Endomicrobiaceae bacterium]
ISNNLKKQLITYQKAEEMGAKLYAFMAHREKNQKNREILKNMSNDELSHAQMWGKYTGIYVKVPAMTLLINKIITVLLGYTFILKKLKKAEQLATKDYNMIQQEIPEAKQMAEDEHKHELELINMLDEERLQYIGSMVLGLNDALVELTGAIAGVTFALNNTKLVALTGIVTGISATLSMAASNYLAEHANGNKNAFKSSVYTGIAYLVTVLLLVLPYLLFPANMYFAAFTTMIITVILIILFFNYYISVAKDAPFLRRFSEMLIISLTVAVLSFVIGILAKKLLGLNI